MRGLILLLVFIGFSCASPQKDKIVVPTLHAGFYSEALDRINDKLKADPDNDRLVDQKLFYCEQLDWPTTCISALDAFKQKHGMTNQLVEQYIAYYQKHERYQLLLNVIDKWNKEYNLTDSFTQTYIECLTRLGKRKRAIIELRAYLLNHQSGTDFEFAARQYLEMKDTLMAAYNLGKLHKEDAQHDLMWEYGNILVNLSYENIGFEVLQDFVIKNKNDRDIQLQYARLLESSNRRNSARSALKPFTESDTVSYLLADWYQKDMMWDSAGLVLNRVIAKDSSNRKPIWKAGVLYEERGWFSTSLSYFEYLVKLNPQDTLAEQRIDLIQRKIAYLQRLKFEENKIPIIELQSKKIEN